MASNTEKAGTSPASQSPTPRTSLINVLLLCSSLIGLGAIGGYIIFNKVIVKRCATLLSASEDRHNESYTDLRTKYTSAVVDAETAWKAAEDEKGQCSAVQAEADATALLKAELDEITGKLEAHSTLAQRHNMILVKMESLKTDLAAAENKSAKSDKEVSRLLSRVQVLEEKLGAASANVRQLEARLADEETKHAEQQSLTARIANERAAQIERLNSALKNRNPKSLMEKIETMRLRIQENCRRSVIEKYGEGPHRVVLTLQFPESQGEVVENKIVIEMAPVTLMPHAVSTFLDMVSKGLYDGQSFFIANKHVVMAGPGHSQPEMRSRIQQAGYEPALSFQEYSEEYPHRRLTVGFAGWPIGGPSFYISLTDNSAVHGPKGDVDEDGLPMPGEPCFGKVVDGMSALDRTQRMPRRRGDEYHFAEIVTIVSARLQKPNLITV